MYRIINSLATAEYNKRLSAVEVNFKGYGEPELYHDTMDIAMNIAAIYDTNHWLFIKDTFEDITETEFLFFVSKWSKQTTHLFMHQSKNQVCKVALLTTLGSEVFLKDNNLWLMNPSLKFPNLNLKIFTEAQEAMQFLAGKPNKMLAV